MPNRFEKLSNIKKAALYCGYISVLLLFFVLGAEWILRGKGIQPWQPAEVGIKVEPGGQLFQPHPELGYIHLPGRFTVTLKTGLSFTLTHLPNTWRITRPLSRYKKEHGKEEIWIFGGSFTHGWCLNDDETYPWRLQKRFPQYKIVNYGVEGYGTVHSLFQMRKALAGGTPKAVVLAYAGFHAERNTFLRHRRKQIAPWCKLGRLVQPYARLNNEGKLVIKMAEVEYREFPLMRYLALAHYVEQIFNRVEDRFHNSQAVTQALVGTMADIAQKHKIPFVLAGIDHGEAMLKYAKTHGIPQIDISVNLRRPYYNNSPHDQHPSAAANQVYAQKLGDFLKKEILP